MGFEPTRAEPNGLAVHRLNHSATSSPLSDDPWIRTFHTLRKNAQRFLTRDFIATKMKVSRTGKLFQMVDIHFSEYTIKKGSSPAIVD